MQYNNNISFPETAFPATTAHHPQVSAWSQLTLSQSQNWAKIFFILIQLLYKPSQLKWTVWFFPLQCRQALWVVYETLQETQVLFQELDLPEEKDGVTWDSNKLGDFLNLQHRLLEEGSCVSIALMSLEPEPLPYVAMVIQHPHPSLCAVVQGSRCVRCAVLLLQ